ncbi:14388_t:CDS:2 [Funneliformis caledonium]|uniref:14388_t:CDS:1 n=1 Tax=Funneliformis caledonium TaxID=1117310 RepID=A0A9N9A538_9GLOM|nr:14388_t:CDS:2 [Funneliformis caledonium]
MYRSSKKVKLISTCDVCQFRKAECDKERPECSTCKKSNIACTYERAAFVKALHDKQIEEEDEFNHLTQFGPLYDESDYLSIVNENQQNVDNVPDNTLDEFPQCFADFRQNDSTESERNCAIPTIPTTSLASVIVTSTATFPLTTETTESTRFDLSDIEQSTSSIYNILNDLPPQSCEFLLNQYRF